MNAALVEAVRKVLKEANDGGEPYVFNPDQVNMLLDLATINKEHPGALKAWAKFHTTMRTLGAAGEALAGVVKWMIVLIAAWASIKSGLATWLIKLVEGGGR